MLSNKMREIYDIIEPYCKSDNAGSYHSNFYPQRIFEICKSNRIDLLWVDLNEPPKGKTQYDWEAVFERNTLCNYVDQGNKIQSLLWHHPI